MTGMDRLLKHIGKKTFVDWLKECLKRYPDGRRLVIKKMEKKTGYTLKSCEDRTKKLYKIIRENRIEEACDAVIESTNFQVTDKMKSKAEKLKKYAE